MCVCRRRGVGGTASTSRFPETHEWDRFGLSWPEGSPAFPRIAARDSLTGAVIRTTPSKHVMFFIWGSAPKVATVAKGEFFCPNCRSQAPYALERISRYFTFFFIPLFPIRTVGEYLQCRTCQTKLQPQVLSLTRGQIEQAIAPWTCTSCGNRNSPSEEFCIACGVPRRQAPPPLPGASGTQVPPPPTGLDPLTVIQSPPPLAGHVPGRKSNLLLYILLGCVGLPICGFVVLIVIAIASPSKSHSGNPTAATGQEEFEEASKSIGSNADGIGHGNTTAAQDLAINLATLLAAAGQKIPHMNDTESLDSTHGAFIVYCQLNKDSCVFLVHVPNLRRYTDEAKRQIADLCFMSAVATLKGADSAAGIRKLSVATRGAFMYDTALIGAYPARVDEASMKNLVKLSTEALDVPGLYSYFLPETAVQAKPASVASTAPSSTPSVTTAPTKATPSLLPLETPIPAPTTSLPPVTLPTASPAPSPLAAPETAPLAPARPKIRPFAERKETPVWVPIYPALAGPAHGMGHDENGVLKGQANLQTTDPLDKVKDFYESKLKADGFEVTEVQPAGRIFQKLEINGQKNGGKQTLRIEIIQMKMRTNVIMNYTDSAPSGTAPAGTPSAAPSAP